MLFTGYALFYFFEQGTAPLAPFHDEVFFYCFHNAILYRFDFFVLDNTRYYLLLQGQFMLLKDVHDLMVFRLRCTFWYKMIFLNFVSKLFNFLLKGKILGLQARLGKKIHETILLIFLVEICFGFVFFSWIGGISTFYQFLSACGQVYFFNWLDCIWLCMFWENSSFLYPWVALSLMLPLLLCCWCFFWR